MLTNIADIYGANVGDKIVLDKDSTVVTDIYSEAVANGKWVDIETHPVNDTFVVSIMDPTKVKVGDIIDHVTNLEEEEGRRAILIPDHIKHSSLKSGCYSKMKGFSFYVGHGYLVVTQKSKMSVNIVLDSDFTEGDVKTVNKSELKNPSSTITRLYSVAKERGFKVHVKNNVTNLVITHKGCIDDDGETVNPRQQSFSAQLRAWLKSLPYDLAVELPEELSSQKPSNYINTVLNKSEYDCKMLHGKVTKRSATLRKRNGKIELVVKGDVIKVIDKPSLTHISSHDRKLINLLLVPHNKTYEDVR